jgi:tRNA uridine 5-carboxymethylaminomethyl modification enzyme
MPQIPCYIAYTNEKTHEIIRGGLDRSPLYSGIIEGVGPRYCPSIEDKVVRFPEKERHQTFIEPEGLDTVEYYPSGMSTSLPVDVQVAFYRSMVGLEKVEIMRPAYGIEYDYVNPIQLHATLETKLVANLYHAGQINGTSGYEEAAGQGLLAGINAARRVQGKSQVVLGRHQAYIGVMIDDLVTLGVKEPYRMFTSRAEYRLLLREGNADQRLRGVGHEIGLVSEEEYERFGRKLAAINAEVLRLGQIKITKDEKQTAWLEGLACGDVQKGTTLEQLLKRPEITYENMAAIDEVSTELDAVVREQVEVQVKYQGYIERQQDQVQRMQKMELTVIPASIDYAAIKGLTTEVREKLEKFRPDTLGQAARIQGITPAALSVLVIALKADGSI